jgi:hypothetical protein
LSKSGAWVKLSANERSHSPILSSSGRAVARPAVVGWYKAYLGFLVFLFLLLVGAGVAILFGTFVTRRSRWYAERANGWHIHWWWTGDVDPSIIGFFLPRSKGAWIFHLVMICIGLTGVHARVFHSAPDFLDQAEK